MSLKCVGGAVATSSGIESVVYITLCNEFEMLEWCRSQLQRKTRAGRLPPERSAPLPGRRDHRARRWSRWWVQPRRQRPQAATRRPFRLRARSWRCRMMSSLKLVGTVPVVLPVSKSTLLTRSPFRSSLRFAQVSGSRGRCRDMVSVIRRSGQPIRRHRS